MNTLDHINLGDRAKDRITGFSGIVICKSEWLNGCNRVSLQPEKLSDGKVVPFDTFDVDQIEVIKRNVINNTGAPAGGPMPNPVRR